MYPVIPPASPQRRRVVILGGSFNPAHAGHVHISREAKRRLKADEVWWLVSPQNPLKQTKDMAPLAERYKEAKRLIASHYQPSAKLWLKASDLEQHIETRYTFDTLLWLSKHYPRYEFIWLMGADNLSQFHRWNHWPRIANMVRIAVMDRAPATHHAQRSKAATRFLGSRIQYDFIPRSPVSASDIRARSRTTASHTHE